MKSPHAFAGHRSGIAANPDHDGGEQNTHANNQNYDVSPPPRPMGQKLPSFLLDRKAVTKSLLWMRRVSMQKRYPIFRIRGRPFPICCGQRLATGSFLDSAIIGVV
jgi:hypothetical protein